MSCSTRDSAPSATMTASKPAERIADTSTAYVLTADRHHRKSQRVHHQSLHESVFRVEFVIAHASYVHAAFGHHVAPGAGAPLRRRRVQGRIRPRTSTTSPTCLREEPDVVDAAPPMASSGEFPGRASSVHHLPIVDVDPELDHALGQRVHLVGSIQRDDRGSCPSLREATSGPPPVRGGSFACWGRPGRRTMDTSLNLRPGERPSARRSRGRDPGRRIGLGGAAPDAFGTERLAEHQLLVFRDLPRDAQQQGEPPRDARASCWSRTRARTPVRY